MADLLNRIKVHNFAIKVHTLLKYEASILIVCNFILIIMMKIDYSVSSILNSETFLL